MKQPGNDRYTGLQVGGPGAIQSRCIVISSKDLGCPDGVARAELRALRTEIRRTCRQANRQAACAGRWGSDAYKSALVKVFDGWIAGSGGQQQLLFFASAAEMGLLLEQHVDRCCATAMQSGRELLRVLYWTVMQRWSTAQRVRAGEVQVPKPVAPAIAVPAVQPSICGECFELTRDPRRASGHPGLYPVSPVSRRHYTPHIVLMLCEHRCRACEAQWMMSSHSADPFVGWTLRRGGQSSEATPGAAFGAVASEVVQREAMRPGQWGTAGNKAGRSQC
ncbi:hypothetical protein [Cupriavidus sp. UYPR2.512]|uniref:hypothetical protein n=1 Tax=Cupriavidus sp. UYPR2.512 TaxID=1080187 RepID=UPI0012F99EAD|nr:hypothetical protein [Cupriavidus sp. UYPR2.512]